MSIEAVSRLSSETPQPLSNSQARTIRATRIALVRAGLYDATAASATGFTLDAKFERLPLGLAGVILAAGIITKRFVEYSAYRRLIRGNTIHNNNNK